MRSEPWSTRPRDATADPELEAALERVLLELEGEQEFDREHLIEQFPQWRNELNQFIDDWLAIERHSDPKSSLHDIPRKTLSHLSVPVDARLGDYQIEEELGSGGMGIIYKAHQISLDRTVALKMIYNARQDRDRFRVEAEAAASLHHNNIVSIYEVGEYEGLPFLSMQFVDGGNLRERLEHGPVSPIDAAPIVETIARAVHYAHQRGILHRDLKPSNVLLDRTGKPYVADFGLAKQIGNSAELTRSGAVLGTPGYMSPEQAMGQVKSITVAADVYGLGAILYALLTGEPPFQGESDLKTLRKVIEDPPENPRTKNPKLDRNIETVCLKCLEKTPSMRYASAKHLADDLARYVGGEPVVARPVGRLERRWRWCLRNPAMAILSFALVSSLAIALLVTIVLALRESRARVDSDDALHRELLLRMEVDRARVAAVEQGEAATQTLIDVYVTNGMWASRTHLDGDALLWFAQAAKAAVGTDEQYRTNLARCVSWMANRPRPIAAMLLEDGFPESTFRENIPNLHLHNEKPQLMCKSDDDLIIWDYSKDLLWRSSEQGIRVTAGTWTQDGERLILGCADGEVRILSADNREVQRSVYVEGAVSRIACAQDSSLIAVATDTDLQVFDTETGAAIGPTRTHSKRLLHVKFGDGDRFLITADAGSTCRVFETHADDGEPQFDIDCYIDKYETFEQELAPFIAGEPPTLFVRTAALLVQAVDPMTGDERSEPLSTGRIFAIAHATDSRSWICCGDNYARLWRYEAESSEDSKFLTHYSQLPHSDRIVTADFCSRNMVATGSVDQEVRIWSVGETRPPGVRQNERQPPLAVLPHTSQVVRVLFSADGNQLVSLQRDGLIRVWSVPSFESPGYRVKVDRGGSIAKIIDDENWLVAGSSHWRSNMVNASVRRIEDGQVMAEMSLANLFERGHLLDSAVSSDGTRLVTLHAGDTRSGNSMVRENGVSGTILQWNLPAGDPIGEPIEVTSEPRSVVFHPDGDRIIVSTAISDLLVIDMADFSIETIVRREKRDDSLDIDSVLRPVFFFNGRLQFNADKSSILEWGVGTGLRVWDVDDWQLRFVLDFARERRVHSLDETVDGELLAVVLEDSSEVVICDAHTGQEIKRILHPGIVNTARFDPSGQFILTACDDGRARVFEALTGERRLAELAHARSLLDACYSPNSNLIATLASDQRIHIWHSENTKFALRPFQAPSGTRRLLFSNNGMDLFAMGVGGEILVLDLRDDVQQGEIDLEHMTQIAELCSAKYFAEDGIVNMTTTEWLKRWRQYSISPIAR